MQKRICKTCEIEKGIEDYYIQNKVKVNGEKYVYVNPSCKKCVIDKAARLQKDNHEEKYKSNKKLREENPEYYKAHRRKHYEKNKDKEAKRLREWQIENKDRVQYYQITRNQNKKHKISKLEWQKCKDYFDNSCGYCGMSIEDHKAKFNQDLHKEHVKHKGSNDISNCIPSCKSCNSSKHDFALEDWYNENNPNYDIERLQKIQQWLSSDWVEYTNHIQTYSEL